MVSGAQPNPSGIAFHFTSASRTDSLFSRSMDVPTRHAATGQDTRQWQYESHVQPCSKCCLHAARRVATVLMVDPARAGSASRSAMDTKKRSCDGQAIAVPGKIAVGTSMQVPFRGPASAVPARRGFRRAGWVRRQAPEPSHAGNAAPGKRGPGRCRTTGGGRSWRAQDAAPAGTSQQRRGHARKEPLPGSRLPTAAAVAYRTTGPRRRAAGRSHAWSGAWPGTGNLRSAPHSSPSRPRAGANNRPGGIASGDGFVTFPRCMAAPPWARSRPPASSAGARWPGWLQRCTASPPE